MHVLYRSFDRRSILKRDTIREQAAKFASEIGHERLINISSRGAGDLLKIDVWYWSDVPRSGGPHQWKSDVGG